MGKKDNILTGFLGILILLIFLITVYFCLDIFGIIEVPEKYSIARLLGTKVSEISVAVNLEEVITNETIDEWINAKPKVVDDPFKRDNGYNEVDFPEITNETTVENQEETTQYENRRNDNVVNRMYYSQLDAYGKLIYLQFIEHKDELIKGTYTADFGTDFNELLHEENGADVLENAFQLSVNSLMFDNPELFYLDVTKMYMYTEITSFGPLKTYRIKIGPAENSNYLLDYFRDEEFAISANNTLEKFRSRFAGEISGLDDYMKVKKVHDYIIENTEYDQYLSKSNIYNTYGALIGHYAVCEGYSKSMKYMLDAVNIPCIIVCGIAQNSNGEAESHAWNYVKINDLWYAVDSTWDDPVIIGTGYVSSSIYTKYFLKGSTEFFKDHFEDGNIVNDSKFVYPTISEENYSK